MDFPVNHNKPLIMHVDLNSCFATIEQQANPLLRGKPIAVAAYDSPAGCIVAPSIEAKTYGIKTGMSVREGKMLYRGLKILTPDPVKYRDVHIKFKNIFKTYSPDVFPKSIDEAVIDFTCMEKLNPDLVSIGKEIKLRMKKEIGEWIVCSVGIATNRFLAKTAASLHKPNGLDVITHENLLDVYSKLQLTDLCGINVKFEARLNAAGIFTPIEFFNAPVDILVKEVFQSIIGRYWYERLHGFEIDDVEFQTKSIGQQFALPKETNDPKLIASYMMKLCEKMGRRLRLHGFTAHGIHVSCVYKDWTTWHRGRLQKTEMYTTMELYRKALLVLNQRPEKKPIYKLGVSCYAFNSKKKAQASLFDFGETKQRKVADAMDVINDKYGEFVITPALMMGMENIILDRVAFGGVKELQDLYI